MKIYRYKFNRIPNSYLEFLKDLPLILNDITNNNDRTSRNERKMNISKVKIENKSKN